MNGTLKVVLWTALAAVIAVAAAVGFGLFQLSKVFPSPDEGRELADQVETQLAADHPDYRVAVAADATFAEIRIEVRPANGELVEPELTQVLQSLHDVVAEHEGSGWELLTTIEGDWDGSRVEIEGTDTDTWAEVTPLLDLAAAGTGTQLTFALDHRRAVVTQDLGGDGQCGTGAEAREVFASAHTEADALLSELGWTAPEHPVLVYLGRACEGSLRVSLDLSGEDRSGRLADLELALDALPDDIVGVTVEPDGNLLVALETDLSQAQAEGLAQGWPHGQVWVNGQLASTP